jgi:hypothetical protein
VNILGSDDVDKFYTFARKWQDLLGLGRWRVATSAKRSAHMAEVVFDNDSSNRLARLLVGKHFGNAPVDDETLEMTAIHEMLHILLKDYKRACVEQPYDETSQMEKEHEIVNVLEKLLYELWHQKHVELPEELPSN